MAFNFISVDIETTGTDPSHTAIIQIGAVAFNMEGEVHNSLFNESLLIPETRRWDEDTRDWWGDQDQAIFMNIWKSMREPGMVLREFREWVLEASMGEEPRMVAKPISFEFPFFQSYFREFGVGNPFHFRQALDLRSILFGRGRHDVEDSVIFEGNPHDALDDALHQARLFLAAYDHEV